MASGPRCSSFSNPPGPPGATLPIGLSLEPGALSELRIPVPDREGVIAEVATLAARLGVNIADLEIAHSLEGRQGVLVLVVGASGLDAVRGRTPGARIPRGPDRVLS